MGPLSESSSAEHRNGTNSTLDRVRLRVTRLMHSARDPMPGAPPRPSSGMTAELAAASRAPAAPERDLSALAQDVAALEQVIEDSEQLIRQAWSVAGDLNQVRRQCRNCDSATMLAEALGTFQGLLNRCRHNVRVASKTVDNLKVLVSAASS